MTIQTGSLCPAAKAADVIGDKWVLLILREMFLGTTRYADFQRALPRISPTVLSKRLKQIEAAGLLVKKTSAGQKSTEYRLTQCGRELAPVLDQMSRWGLRWARKRLKDEDLEVGSFMWDFHRSLNTNALPDGETVFCVSMPELSAYNRWWMIASGDTVDLCTDDPGKDVDLYLTASLPTLASVWMGDEDAAAAARDERLTMTGAAHLTRSANQWFPRSIYSDVRPGRLDDQPVE